MLLGTFLYLLLPVLEPVQCLPYTVPPSRNTPYPQQRNTVLSNDPNLDKVTDITANPTQIVVHTSKQGSATSLRVRLEVFDVEEQRALAPIELSGPWLSVSRGKYSIPFLRPAHLYAIRFLSEKVENNVVLSHVERFLVRTASRDGKETAIDPTHVTLHRSEHGEENAEGLFATAAWDAVGQSLHDAVVDVTLRVECDNSSAKRTFQVSEHQRQVTVDISIDHRYELQDVDKSKHEVRAVITPLSCHKVCWNKELVVTVRGERYTKHLEDECAGLKSIQLMTVVRDLMRYSIEIDDAFRTTLLMETRNVPNEDAFVTVRAIPLFSNMSTIVKSYETIKSDGRFKMALPSDDLYAVKYTYTKRRPFHYSNEEHFLVEAPAPNSTRSSHSIVSFRFEPQEDEVKGRKAKEPDEPTMYITKAIQLHARNVSVDVEPLCDQPRTLLHLETVRSVNLTSSLCSFAPSLYFCNDDIVYPFCDTNLCYTTSIVMNGSIFSTGRRCINVTMPYQALITASCFSHNAILSLSILFVYIWTIL